MTALSIGELPGLQTRFPSHSPNEELSAVTVQPRGPRAKREKTGAQARVRFLFCFRLAASHFWAPAAGCTRYIPILSSVPLCAVGEQTHSAESRGAAGGNAGNGGAGQPPSPGTRRAREPGAGRGSLPGGRKTLEMLIHYENERIH